MQVVDITWLYSMNGVSTPQSDVACWQSEAPRSTLGAASRIQQYQQVVAAASKSSSASQCCGWLLGLLTALGCSGNPAVQIHEFGQPSSAERYCAWFGEARDGVLYFGQAPFWSAARQANAPEADLAVPGPQWIGRFDLAAREPQPTLDVSANGARSGVWDVLPHPNGRVYFTTFYEPAGSIDLATGDVARYPDLGTGLNELAFGPEDAIVATRYAGRGDDPRGSGSLVLFSPEGLLLAEYPLRAPIGYALAPKTAAWDEAGNRYWLSTDLVRRDPDAPPAPSEHPAIVLDAGGSEIARIGGVELHFVRFGRDGRGVAAYVAEGELRLVELGPGEPRRQLAPGSGELLDANFPALLDFVQDISFGPERETIVTRWSGRVHVLGLGGERRDLQLPRDDPAGLYYSAALSAGEICATYCADVAVVCARLP